MNPARFTYLPNVLHMLFLGLGASALCFVTWNYAVGVLGAVRTSVYIYFSPIITVVTSALILRERITPWQSSGRTRTGGPLPFRSENLFRREKKNEDNRNETGDPDPEE